MPRFRLDVATRAGTYVLFDPGAVASVAPLGRPQLLAPSPTGDETVLDAEVRAGRMFVVDVEGPGLSFDVLVGEPAPPELLRRASASMKELRLEVPTGVLQAGPLSTLPLADRKTWEKPVASVVTLTPGVYRMHAFSVRPELERNARSRAQRSENVLAAGCIASVAVLGIAIGLLFARAFLWSGVLTAATFAVWFVALVIAVVRDERARPTVAIVLEGPLETPPAESGRLRIRAPRAG